MYDIDNNGFLDKNDFECLAVRNTVIEGKGEWDDAKFKKNQEVMKNLWNEIADLADFNKVQQQQHKPAVPNLGSISSTFYSKLLLVQIQKAQKITCAQFSR